MRMRAIRVVKSYAPIFGNLDDDDDDDGDDEHLPQSPGITKHTRTRYLVPDDPSDEDYLPQSLGVVDLADSLPDAPEDDDDDHRLPRSLGTIDLTDSHSDAPGEHDDVLLGLSDNAQDSPTRSAKWRARTAPSSPRTPKGKTGKVGFAWTKAHRHALILLRDRFKCGWDDAAAVFNEIFNDDIVAQGFSREGIHRGKLTAQYGERNKETNKSWRDIMNPSPSEQQELEQMASIIQRHLHKHPPSAQVSTTASTPASTTASKRQALSSSDQALVVSRSQSRRATDMPQRHLVTPAKRRRTFNLPESMPLTPSSNTDDMLIFDTPPSSRRPISEHVVQSYEYVPVTKEAAHPTLPALFYRVYDENSHGVNDSNGFVASQCVYTQGGYPPAPEASSPLMYMYLENHINRNPVSTPFISVSVDPRWVIRMAFKSSSKGSKYPRIAIIDAAKAAEGDKAFFVPPYHKELKNKQIFTEGAWRYSGSHEWVIWADIPKSAIIYDVAIQDLQAKVENLPAVSQALRFDILSTTQKISNTNLMAYLKEQQAPLSSSLTAGFAQLLLKLGVDATAPEKVIRKLVSDLIQGWQIGIKADSNGRWRRLAGLFAYELTEGMDTADAEGRLEVVERAFLHGLASGMGDMNWAKNQILTRRMMKRAEKVGLAVAAEGGTRRLLEAVVIPSGPSVDLSQYRFVGNSG